MGTQQFDRLINRTDAVLTELLQKTEPADSQTVRPTSAATGTLTNVAATTASVTVLASNAARLGAVVFNDSTAILYLKAGTAAATTSFTVLMGSSAYYEGPFGYTGIWAGIWTAATGTARVTEMT